MVVAYRSRSIVLGMAALILAAASILPTRGNAAPAASRITSVKVIGTAFRVTLASGRTLEGRDLAGATISVALVGKSRPLRVRLAKIIPDPSDPQGDVLLYDMRIAGPSGRASVPLCEHEVDGGHWAFPLRGQWDKDGQRISDTGFTLTCAADAQGKCVRFGYKPWKTGPGGVSLAAYHQACIRMVRADYCGNAGTTRAGMLIDYYDRLGIQRRAKTVSPRALPFEAAWNTKGAVCVAHTRVPEHMTLARLAATCPHLRGRLGPAVCTETAAASGQFGRVLLFNRSKVGGGER